MIARSNGIMCFRAWLWFSMKETEVMWETERILIYSRTPLIGTPSESHWCGRIRGMVAREGFVYKQKALSVTRNVVVWEGWSLVRVVVRQGFYCNLEGWDQAREWHGSHRNVITKSHDFSMTIYTVLHDARKANPEYHMHVFITYLYIYHLYGPGREDVSGQVIRKETVRKTETRWKACNLSRDLESVRLEVGT